MKDKTSIRSGPKASQGLLSHRSRVLLYHKYLEIQKSWPWVGSLNRTPYLFGLD